MPGPWPLLPPNNWWNTEVAAAQVDPSSAAFIIYINREGVKHPHPDLGGMLDAGVSIYRNSFIIVDGNQPKKTVNYFYYDERDDVNHQANNPYPCLSDPG